MDEEIRRLERLFASDASVERVAGLARAFLRAGQLDELAALLVEHRDVPLAFIGFTEMLRLADDPPRFRVRSGRESAFLWLHRRGLSGVEGTGDPAAFEARGAPYVVGDGESVARGLVRMPGQQLSAWRFGEEGGVILELSRADRSRALLRVPLELQRQERLRAEGYPPGRTKPRCTKRAGVYCPR